ncbi:hypothetical protein MCELHM10_02129 [Paracoccaceae bacterium]
MLTLSRSNPSRRRVLSVASGVGHWVQLMRLRPALDGTEIHYATVDPSARAMVAPATVHLYPDAKKDTLLRMALAALALVGFVASAQARTVTHDPGGVISDRLTYVVGNWYEEVRVTGFCASACTFYLAMPNACTTKKARWLFHGPKGDSAKDEADWVPVIAAMYPEPVKTAFLTDYQFREVILSGAELIRVGAIRECD